MALRINALKEIICIEMNNILAFFEDMDPNRERFARFERVVLDALRPYQEVYEEKKKKTIQTKLTMFIREAPTPRPTPTSTEDPDDPQPRFSKESFFLILHII